MDDTPDKLRRNVVALSAAILAIAVLNLQFTPSGTVLGIATISNLAGWKIWICLSIALLYVFLRYRFDAITEQALDAAAADFKKLRQGLLEQTSAHALERYLHGARAAPWLVGLETMGGAERWKTHCETYGQPIAIKVSSQLSQLQGNPWKGVFNFTMDATWNGGNDWAGVGGMRCHFMVGAVAQVAFILHAATRALYSKGAIDVALPFVVAAIAGFICLFKLGFSLGAIR